MRIKVDVENALALRAPWIGTRLGLVAAIALLATAKSAWAGTVPLNSNPDWGAAMALLATEDYRGAMLALDSEPDDVLRLDGEAQIYYAASDPGAALEAAEKGLRLAPMNLNLRFRAIASALWLGAGERALAHNQALKEALLSSNLSDEERALWEQAQADYGREALALIDLDEARATALARAHGVAWIGLGLLMAGLVWALLAPQAGMARRP